MAMIRKTITISKEMERWIKTQIDEGRYAGDSEYFRDLIRRDQDSQPGGAEIATRAAPFAARQKTADEPAQAQPGAAGEEIWEEVEARLNSLDAQLLSGRRRRH